MFVQLKKSEKTFSFAFSSRCSTFLPAFDSLGGHRRALGRSLLEKSECCFKFLELLKKSDCETKNICGILMSRSTTSRAAAPAPAFSCLCEPWRSDPV